MAQAAREAEIQAAREAEEQKQDQHGIQGAGGVVEQNNNQLGNRQNVLMNDPGFAKYLKFKNNIRFSLSQIRQRIVEDDSGYTQADIDLFFDASEIKEAGPHIVPKPRVA